MRTRRDFVRLSAAVGLASVAQGAEASKAAAPRFASLPPMPDRADWMRWAVRLADPLLNALASRRLKVLMPVESHPSSKDRPQYTYLEGLGRLLAGLAPWLELGGDGSPEGKERGRLTALVRQGIDAATDSASPDLMNFSR